MKGKSWAGAVALIACAATTAASAQDAIAVATQQLVKAGSSGDTFIGLVAGRNGEPMAAALAGSQPMPGSAAELAAWIQTGKIQHTDLQSLTLTDTNLQAGSIQYTPPPINKKPLAFPTITFPNCGTDMASMAMNFSETTTDSTTFTTSATSGWGLNVTIGFTAPSVTGGPMASSTVNVNSSQTTSTSSTTSKSRTWALSTNIPVPAKKKVIAQMVVVEGSYDNVPWTANLSANPNQQFSFMYYMRGPVGPGGAEWVGNVTRRRLGDYFTATQLNSLQLNGTFSGVAGASAEVRMSQPMDIDPAVDCYQPSGQTMMASRPPMRAAAPTTPMANPAMVIPVQSR